MKLSVRYWTVFQNIFIVIFLTISSLYSKNGILRVGFDVDDTVLFSRDVFLNLPEDKQSPTDWSWINSHDEDFSLIMEPTVELVHFFRDNGHKVFFITARHNANIPR